MAGMPLDAANFLGLNFCIFLYAIYLALFFATFRYIYTRGKRLPKVVQVILIILFICSSSNIVILWYDAYLMFITYRDTPGTLPYIWGYSDKFAPASHCIYFVCTLLADGLQLWRLYTVWESGFSQRNWRLYVMAMPLLLYGGQVVTGALTAGYEIAVSWLGWNKYEAETNLYGDLGFAFTLVNNIIVTLLIAGRLWKVKQELSDQADRTRKMYEHVVFTFIQSGALFSIAVGAELIVYAQQSNPGIYFVLYLLSVIVGISPTLLVLQLMIGSHAADNTLVDDNIPPLSTMPQWAHGAKTDRTPREADTACSTGVGVWATGSLVTPVGGNGANSIGTAVDTSMDPTISATRSI